jgi:hypothetical protein
LAWFGLAEFCLVAGMIGVIRNIFRDILSISLIAFPVILVGFCVFLFLSRLCAKAGVPQVGWPDAKQAFCGA